MTTVGGFLPKKFAIDSDNAIERPGAPSSIIVDHHNDIEDESSLESSLYFDEEHGRKMQPTSSALAEFGQPIVKHPVMNTPPELPSNIIVPTNNDTHLVESSPAQNREDQDNHIKEKNSFLTEFSTFISKQPPARRFIFYFSVFLVLCSAGLAAVGLGMSLTPSKEAYKITDGYYSKSEQGDLSSADSVEDFSGNEYASTRNFIPNGPKSMDSDDSSEKTDYPTWAPVLQTASEELGEMTNWANTPLIDSTDETPEPTSKPTKRSRRPTSRPTPKPIMNVADLFPGGTSPPSASPTFAPLANSNKAPTSTPTGSPTKAVTPEPTRTPTAAPTTSPSYKPTSNPTQKPTKKPTTSPSQQPTSAPSKEPTVIPTFSPSTDTTNAPSSSPSEPFPTRIPSVDATTLPSSSPFSSASVSDSVTLQPSSSPSESTTGSPSSSPTTKIPTFSPTTKETVESISNDPIDASWIVMRSDVITPMADTFIQYDNQVARGSNERLKVDGRPKRLSLISFDTSKYRDEAVGISKATLRLHSLTSSGFGGQIDLLPESCSEWDYSTITYDNAPQCVVDPLMGLGAFSSVEENEWNEADLDLDLMFLPSILTLRLSSNFTNGVAYSSMEDPNGFIPELVIEYTVEVTSGPTSSPTGSPTRSPTTSPTKTPTRSPTESTSKPVEGIEELAEAEQTEVLQPILLTHVLTPVSDTFIEANNNNPMGVRGRLKVDGSPQRVTFIRFDTSYILKNNPVNITSSSLWLYALTSSPYGGQVDLLDGQICTDWDESELAWSNAPPSVQDPAKGLGEYGAIKEYSWNQASLEIDLDQLHSMSMLTIRISTTESDGVTYSSLENPNGTAPELVVSYYGFPPEETETPTYFPTSMEPTYTPTVSFEPTPSPTDEKQPTLAPSHSPVKRLVIPAEKDAMIRGGDNSNRYYGYDPYMALKSSTVDSDNRKAIIQFDLSEAVPNGSYSYELELFITYVSNDDHRAVTVFQILEGITWNEGSTSWDNFGNPFMEPVTAFAVLSDDKDKTKNISLGKLQPVGNKLTFLLEITSSPSDGSKFDLTSKENRWKGPILIAS